MRELRPLTLHLALVDWLKTREDETWRWYADSEMKTRDAEQVRLSLLKDTYRMDAEGHPELFVEIEAARAALGLDGVEVHAYQSQEQGQCNAAICYLPGEAHLIFSGPILSVLSAEELRAVIGHELAHYLLWDRDGGDFFLADRILHLAAGHPGAKPAHGQTVRLWRLATEFFADRGALVACGDLDVAVSSLVKSITGLSKISAKAYLSQAEEIFTKSKAKSEGVSHPETYMRARALQLWAADDGAVDEAVMQMLVEGEDLGALDLLQQAELTTLTKRFLSCHLSPGWFRSEAVLAHAKMYFPGIEISGEADEGLEAEVAALSKSRREFLCQVMLDFCAVDPDLEDLPVAAAIVRAREMEMLGHFEKIAAKDLKMKPKQLKTLKENAGNLLAAADKSTP